ncbi:MAG: DUF4238 domain-containing protein [Actinomycetota bacterium]|nr:DUF4238 domain-containing protein [Actinomycetota bacterium]
MGQTPAKKHHYVPQFYLRGFAQNEQIVTVRLPGERRYTRHIRQTAAENGFYAVPGHPEGADTFEKDFNQLETDAAAVFRKIGAGTWPLPTEDRAVLATFIAVQAIRGPEHRRNMEHVMRQVVQIQLTVAGKDGLKRLMKGRAGQDIDDATAALIWEQATQPGEPPLKMSAMAHIQQIGQTVLALIPYIAGRPWTLVQFDRRSLLTCDTPVALVPHPEGEAEDDEYTQPSGVGFMTAWGITYPLTRKLGLLMSDPMILPDDITVEDVARGNLDRAQPGTTELERFFNLYTTMNASAALFHHPADGGFVADTLPAPTPVTVRMDGFGAASGFTDQLS